MMGLSNLALLRLSRFCAVLNIRNIMTSNPRLEKALEELEKNSYYQKYADKIAKIQQTSPEEFLSKVDRLEKAKTRPKNTEPGVDSKYSQLLKPKQPLAEAGSAQMPLDKVMKMELIEGKTTDEIKQIWEEYHLKKNFIAAVIPAEDYEELEKRGRQYPTFLFALPRSQGYEFVMSQFDANTIHFTPLLYYQVHKENAPECLTIAHYTELKENKGIVLMRGEYDKNVIDIKGAQCLANQLLLYYVRPSEEKLAILEKFTKKPDDFKHMELIRQIETLSLS